MRGFFAPAARLATVTAMFSVLAACGGGGGGGGGGGSSASDDRGLVLNITDAPVVDEDISEVWVRFTQVIVHPSDGGEDIVYSVQSPSDDPDNPNDYRDIELTSLVGGKTMLLGEIPLEAGDYSWIRLVIQPENTRVIEKSGGDFLVSCPSCTESGFKLNREFTIDTTGWIDFTIDFDLRKSLTLRQPNKNPRENYDYVLRPTLRILDTELASTYIHGLVTDQRSEQDNPDFPDACWVYVYDGIDGVDPDDICLLADTDICPESDRPLLETPVQFDDGSGDYAYHTGFMYPGSYTVALVCEPDDPEVDENLLFMSATGVDATEAAAAGAEQDLALVDVPVLALEKSLYGNADEDGSNSVTVNDTLTYLLQLRNEGNVALTGVTVTDPLAGLSAIDCGESLPTTVAKGASLDCTATYVVPDVESIENTATADSAETDPVSDSETVEVVPVEPAPV